MVVAQVEAVVADRLDVGGCVVGGGGLVGSRGLGGETSGTAAAHHRASRTLTQTASARLDCSTALLVNSDVSTITVKGTPKHAVVIPETTFVKSGASAQNFCAFV